MRLHFTFACITLALLIVTLRYHHHKHFSFNEVIDLAAQLAKQKYNPHDREIPQELRAINQDQLGDIQWKDEYTLWRKRGLPFQIRLWHVGGAYATKSVQMNIVDNRGTHPLAYSSAFFDFGSTHLSDAILRNLQYAGFWIFYPLNKPNEPSELGSFKGGTYFRMLAQNQAYGISARCIAINTMLDDLNEEFPDFREFWLQEPTNGATEMTIYALMDGPSVTGAFSFHIRPGSETAVDIQASLFFRQKVARLGLMPFSSMFLWDQNSQNRFGDTFHPEVHDSDGLLIQTGAGEWIWRPLQQRINHTQKYTFTDTDPHGFGLLQRNRDIQHYQDLDKKYNIRPSVWVEPHTPLGKGTVELSQLYSGDFNTDNVVLFWQPEKKPLPGDRLNLDYTLHWFMNDATRPPLAYVKQTLINAPTLGKPPSPPTARAATPPPALTAPLVVSPPLTHIYIDFAGAGIENLPANTLTDTETTSNPPGAISDIQVQKNVFDNSWRVSFAVTSTSPDATELRCRLMRKGQPVSETWSFPWYPPSQP